MVPTEKLTEIDTKGIKGNNNYCIQLDNKQFNENKYFIGAKELSRVVYSAERGKLETVLLKPGSNVGTKG
jgi:hypothetical protein